MSGPLSKKCALFFAFAVFLPSLFLLQPYQVVGRSMEPTFEEGDWVWTVPLFSMPSRGDCVIFEDPWTGKKAMKRVAGLPQEALDRFYFSAGKSSAPIQFHQGQWAEASSERRSLPVGHFFLVGDRAASSQDSRGYGPVARKKIFRRVLGATDVRKIERPI